MLAFGLGFYSPNDGTLQWVRLSDGLASAFAPNTMLTPTMPAFNLYFPKRATTTMGGLRLASVLVFPTGAGDCPERSDWLGWLLCFSSTTLAVCHRPLHWPTTCRGSALLSMRASPRSARRLIELTERSAPLREAQHTNWLPNADEALLSFESQIWQPPVNSSMIEGKGIW